MQKLLAFSLSIRGYLLKRTQGWKLVSSNIRGFMNDIVRSRRRIWILGGFNFLLGGKTCQIVTWHTGELNKAVNLKWIRI